MKINLEQLQLLDAIDRLGSFSAAADELYRARSAVTYAIKNMENTLGIQLFDRSGHRAALTDVGKLLLQDGRKILMEVSDLQSRVKAIAEGWEPKFRIAYDDALAYTELLPMINQFYQACPNTNLTLSAEILGGCWDALIHDRADLAIGVSGLMPGREQYIFKPLGQLNFDFVVSTTHPLNNLKEPLSADQINQYPAIYVSDSARFLPEQTFDVQSPSQSLTVGSMREKAEAIAYGIGVGFLPRKLADDEVKRKRLCIKKVDVVRSSAHLAIAWHKNKAEGKAMQWWIEKLQSAGLSKVWLP